MGKRQSDKLAKLFGGGTLSNSQPRRTQPNPKETGGESSVKQRTLESSSVCDASITEQAVSEATALLIKLQQHPDLFRSSRFKALRAAVYPLVQPAGPVGFVNRASDAIADGRWNDALIALRAMRAIGEIPKLGSVQRWIRDCDLAAGDDDLDGLRCMDAILRTASPEQICSQPTANFDSVTSPVLLREPEWQGRPSLIDLPPPPLHATIEELASKFRILFVEPARQRRPPNLHDMILYTCPSNTVPMRDPSRVEVKRRNVPFAPESFFIDGLLSPEEAQTVVAVAERVGFTPDVPQTGKKSILAHHFVWLADEGFIGNLFERCKSIVPSVLHKGRVMGINRRLRCYRYVPGAVYRAHVDGAWPPSGISDAGEYVYDISEGKVLSRLTFLLYLNEDFEGGWTTYYTPAFEEGHLKVTPVKPRIGCAMVFPHGDTAGCLVHEGSEVLQGTKYIIRTEVLYESN